jgi:HAD superfamily hydrolase (TIGR01450 family)|uniref:HAD-IIA family hydrolase n=1 Tax=Mesoaciditoga lauensis TaxID=1495039 RepID=A0A7V3VTD0_9BACT
MIRAFMIDLDGVVYRGDTVRKGAKDFFEYLKKKEILHCVITNHSSFHRKYYSQKLKRMGIDVPMENVVSTPYEVAMEIQKLGYHKAFVIGRQGLIDELFDVGCHLIDEPDVVIVGYDERYDFVKLTKALRWVLKGKPLWVVNPDRLLPKEDGFYPDSGSLAAPIVYATKTVPVYFGKPNVHIFDMALDLMKVKAEEAIMIGDTYETDIVGAKAAGIKSIYIEGIEANPEVALKPDYTFKDLSEVLDGMDEIIRREK